MTAVLLAATLYSGFRASRKSALANRVDHGLHAVMMAAMVLMLAPGVQWAVLPQILVFVLAAGWFLIQAASLPAIHGAGTGLAGRGKPLYDALVMAAMAYMLAAMAFHGTREAGAGTDVAVILGQSSHHREDAAAGQPLARPLQDWGGQPALLLAVAFSVAGALWAVRMLRQLRDEAKAQPARPGQGPSGRRFTVHHRSGRRLPARNSPGQGSLRICDTVLELVGAASMAVMFAALVP
jgi:hypothetical protein